MAKSASSLASFAALLMVTAAVAQLLPPTTNERDKAAALARDYPDQERSSDDSRDLSSRLRQLLLGERNTISDPENSKTDEDEASRRRGVELLMRLLTNGEGNDTPGKKKRTCKVNLGGNCATEDALSVADNWHYINSALSPGRRRRSAGDRSPLSQQQRQRRFAKD